MTDETAIHRKLPIGAEIVTGGVHFRLWAPTANKIRIFFLADPHQQAVVNEQLPSPADMAAELGGYWSCLVNEAKPDMLYAFQLDEREQLLPDPASRYQPYGPHEASQIIDCSGFAWTDGEWTGFSRTNRVIYEMHIGTFTRHGTYRAAAAELPELAHLGINAIELMPIAEFSGEYGWGYDGVDLYAPYHHYGTPDDLRYFVDQAHGLGIGVILDVVYNHCGSDGCYLTQFSKHYFTDRYQCEWGEAFNFDGTDSAPVREFIVANVIYWTLEFHIDGFRLDATQQIFDASSEHIIAELVRAARNAAGKRSLFFVGENEPQNVKVVLPSRLDGYDLDCVWNDDFHHSAAVAMKGSTEAYFNDYKGEPQEFISAAKHGFLYQGQWYRWQQKRRGTPSLQLPATAFVHFIQNHDQIANTGLGKRIHEVANPGLFRAFTALLLLGPATPMLFQGQEFCASSPFLYFADHHTELAEQVRQGRRKFLHQFPSLANEETQDYLAQPDDPYTYLRCQLDLSERTRHKAAYALHRDLLELRNNDPVFSQQYLHGVDGAVLSSSALVLRFFADDFIGDRLLIMNFGRDLPLSPAPEPLLAPPEDSDWQLLWSSEHPRYGGRGTSHINTDDRWTIPGYLTLVFRTSDRGDS